MDRHPAIQEVWTTPRDTLGNVTSRRIRIYCIGRRLQGSLRQSLASVSVSLCKSSAKNRVSACPAGTCSRFNHLKVTQLFESNRVFGNRSRVLFEFGNLCFDIGHYR